MEVALGCHDFWFPKRENCPKKQKKKKHNLQAPKVEIHVVIPAFYFRCMTVM